MKNPDLDKSKVRLSCYDKYRKQKLILTIGSEFSDGIHIDSYSSLLASAPDTLYFSIPEGDDGEDPRPERWSDLTDWKLLT